MGPLERLLALCAATGPGLTGGGCRGVSPNALLRRLLPICRGELNFQRMDLVPLGIGALTLRYRQKVLQAATGGHRLWCIHGGIIPSFGRCSPTGAKPSILL
jgi:hypothetical protein